MAFKTWVSGPCWHVSLRHHDPQRQNVTEASSAIENAETGSAIELSCQTNRRTDLSSLLFSSSLDLSSLLLFFPVSSSSSSLTCSSAALLLRATLRPCSELENGRACSTRAGDQRTGRPSVTDLARHPPRRARWVEIRESKNAGPGPVVRL